MNFQYINQFVKRRKLIKTLPDNDLLGKIGDLSTRLAVNSFEIKQAQKLRYDVFYSEMSAKKRLRQKITRRDKDHHDLDCDHILVLDNELDPKLVATQRLKTGSNKDKKLSFYSQSEYDVKALVRKHDQLLFMELGRSCVLPKYRSKRTLELLWQGTWAYAVEKKVDVLIGCASFELSNLNNSLNAMKFLAEHSGLNDDWHAPARAEDIIDLQGLKINSVDLKTAMKNMPPLIKGYLRVGARFSREAVIDHEFGTVDMLVVLPVKDINPRYIKYYGADAERHRPLAHA